MTENTKRERILVCQKLLENPNKMKGHTFSLTTKDGCHYQYWQIPKLSTKNNDRIYFLCIVCNPQHCGSIFYAWITARKQSLLVLSMQGTQKRENCWEWVETQKTRIGLGVENKSKQPQELETTTVWLQQQTWNWLYLLIS